MYLYIFLSVLATVTIGFWVFILTSDYYDKREIGQNVRKTTQTYNLLREAEADGIEKTEVPMLKCPQCGCIYGELNE